jgi:hypothetical protein
MELISNRWFSPYPARSGQQVRKRKPELYSVFILLSHFFIVKRRIGNGIGAKFKQKRELFVQVTALIEVVLFADKIVSIFHIIVESCVKVAATKLGVGREF